jgi:hypothetical protein
LERSVAELWDTRSEQRDYFVLDRGSAANESGFHAFLAQFLDWDLPIVARYDGTECPLYLEAIFSDAIRRAEAGMVHDPRSVPDLLAHPGCCKAGHGISAGSGDCEKPSTACGIAGGHLRIAWALVGPSQEHGRSSSARGQNQRSCRPTERRVCGGADA